MSRSPQQFWWRQLAETDPLKRIIHISHHGAGCSKERLAQLLTADIPGPGNKKSPKIQHQELDWFLHHLWSAYENKSQCIMLDVVMASSMGGSGRVRHGLDIPRLHILKALLTELIAFGDGKTLRLYGILFRVTVYVGFWKSGLFTSTAKWSWLLAGLTYLYVLSYKIRD